MLVHRDFEAVLEAARDVLQQFDELSAYQHEQLVRNQTLESASRNWETMEPRSIDFSRLRAAVRAYR